jgi:hypothetical protein
MQHGFAILLLDSEETVEVLVVANGCDLFARLIYGCTATEVVGVLIALIYAPMRQILIQERLPALIVRRATCREEYCAQSK